MNRKVRKSIFIAFLALFCLAVPPLVYYAMGYRFDFNQKKITFVGAISIDTAPKGATVFLNGAPAKESANLLSSQIFIKNLIPQSYQIRVEKEGYWPWEKTLVVPPRNVTKAEFITFFKKDPPIESLAKDIQRIDFSPSSNKILYQIEQPVVQECNKLNECKSKPAPKKIGVASFDGSQISDSAFFDVPFLERYDVLSWNKDENEVLLADPENNKFFAVELKQKNIERLPSEVFFGNEPLKINNPQLSPENNSLFTFSYNQKLYVYDRTTHKTSLLVENILSLSQYNNSYYYLKTDGIVYKNNQTFTEESRVYDKPITSFNPLSNYSIPISGSSLTGSVVIAIIERNNNKSFWYLDKNSASPTLVADSVQGAQFSWDLKKILLNFSDKILVYYIDTVEEQPRHDAGEKEELFTSDTPIKDARWLTQRENYVVVTTKNFIDMVELDGRDKRNIVRFLVLNDLKDIFYYKNEKAIYVLDGPELKKILFDY